MSTINITDNSFFANLEGFLEDLSNDEEANLVGGRRGRRRRRRHDVNEDNHANDPNHP